MGPGNSAALGHKNYCKAYRLMNKSEIKKQKKIYYQSIKSNPDFRLKKKIAIKKWREKNKGKDRAYEEKALKNNPLYKMKKLLRARINAGFKSKRWSKNNSTEIIIGISFKDAKVYLERQFKDGMTWENHGEWHIDHIIPLALAKTEKEMKSLCHYTNLQPLWAEENFKKSNKISSTQTNLII